MEQRECANCSEIRSIDKFTPIAFNKHELVRDIKCDNCKKKEGMSTNIGSMDPNEGKLLLCRMTSEHYNRLFLEQEGRCKICSKHQSQCKKRLAIDHNHATDEVRGLLCNHCNLALGLFRDNVESFKNAIKYLENGGLCLNPGR